MCLKRDGTRPETRFRLSPKRTSPFTSTGASVQSTAGSRGVRISGSNAGSTTFRGCVKSTGYPLHSPVSPSLPLPCVTVCHQVSNAFYIYISEGMLGLPLLEGVSRILSLRHGFAVTNSVNVVLSENTDLTRDSEL